MDTVTMKYVDLYESHKDIIWENSSEILNNLRSEAISNFKKEGLPTRKSEKYKYTPIAKSFDAHYNVHFDKQGGGLERGQKFNCDVLDLDTIQAFLFNDSFIVDKTLTSSLPKGVTIGGLNDMSEKFLEWFAKYYGKIANTRDDSITALNTALVQDGIFVYISKDTIVDKPIQLINLLGGDLETMVNRRLLIIAEENSQVDILLCNHSISSSKTLMTGVTEIYALDNAQVNFYEIEETNELSHRFNNTFLYQEKGSNVHLNGMTLHNGLSCNTTNVILAGQGAHIDCNGMAIVDKNQHVDNITLIDHAVPNCTSHELFKYVQDDSSLGAFTGMILVRPNAQKTNSEQTCRSICLTNDARMHARPQLEIYADDVKCGHGATVGQLDENALFYMRSRGLTVDEARFLLMFAFINEVVDTLSIDSLKNRLHILVEKRFRGEVCHCKEDALDKEIKCF